MAAVEAGTFSQWRTKRHRVFQSVFQADITRLPSVPHTGRPSSSVTRPSFAATPSVSQSIFAQYHHASDASSPGRYDHSQLESAWNLVTTKLQLSLLVPCQNLDDEPVLQLFDTRDDHADFNAAVHLLYEPRKLQLGHAVASEYDIVAWFDHQVRCHFVQHVLPRLADLSRGLPASGPRKDIFDGCMAIIRNAVKTLRTAENYYVQRLNAIVGALSGYQAEDSGHEAELITGRFTSELHALVTNSFHTIAKPLKFVLDLHVAEALELPDSPMVTISRANPDPLMPSETRLVALVQVLDEAGLAGERFQVLFAEIMDKNMTQYIYQTYARVWNPSSKLASSGVNGIPAKSLSGSQPSRCIASLCDWVENRFSRVALLVLSQVARATSCKNSVSLADIHQWKEIGIGRLAALRISELFDIVLQWPASKGALDDLKASVTSPQRRWELTAAFSAALQKRLLHPARSTLDILRFYVSMIRAFHALDHSKVLLSRVVPSLQLYLVQREDGVRMVVKGLLASPEEVEQAQKATSPASDIDAEGGAGRASKKLVELAMLLNDPDHKRRMVVVEEDLDWDDMEWLPDPVDAGVNYKRPRSEDVIGTLINTLGSEDVFIKEFQNIISEHLLSTQTNFAQEQKLLVLLKRRFGEAAVQNCEVMIKDIFDSRMVDSRIRRIELGQPLVPARAFGITPVDMYKQLDTDEESQGRVPYRARILSRFYWPNIVQEAFHLPSPVAEIQKRYEAGFEKLKSARKLTWLQQLGQATVELEMEDRTVVVDCRTFEAAVIYAFQQDGDVVQEGDHGPIRLSLQDLQEKLQMDEELVLQAIEFWLSQQVLVRYSTDPETYTVLERKDSPPARPELHPSASAPAAMEGEHELSGMPPKPAGVKRAGTTSAMDAKENERRDIYWQFIVGMLTNSMATMPLGQMAMMLRMVIPDGLPWSDQELQEFLMEKVAVGELEVAGGKYRLAKK